MIVALGGIIMLGLIGYGLVVCVWVAWMIFAGMGDSTKPAYFLIVLAVALAYLWRHVFTTFFDLSVATT